MYCFEKEWFLCTRQPFTTCWTTFARAARSTASIFYGARNFNGRRSTLFAHQQLQLAQQTPGFRGMTEHQNRAFVQVLREEAARLPDNDQMLVFAKRWLYDLK